ncbi:MAG TPA: sulfotransferase family protein [Acidimicrobiia bacterium]
MAPHPILVLWATPRTVSTAFERMMIERGDHTVFDEPYSRHYYFGREKRSRRFADMLPFSGPDDILDRLEAAAERAPVFVKDMAYHVDALARPELMVRFVNTFLVRDPAAAIPSLAARWPDFTDEEAGYDALAHLVAVVDDLGHDVVIVDADDLCRDPPGIVRAYCERVGIPFVAEALHWEAGMRPEWELWRDWYEAAAASTGFGPPTGPPAPPLRGDARVARAYERCLPVYEALRARRLRATPATG